MHKITIDSFMESKLIVLPVISGMVFSCINKTEKTSMPNIIIAISDDQSFSHTSANGCKFVNTPAFDYVASKGILFSNCFAPSPGSAPSRAALLTGRYPWQNEQAGQHASFFPSKYITLADVLLENGYHAGYTGKGCSPFNWKTGGRLFDPAGPGDGNFVEYTKEQQPNRSISKYNYYEGFVEFLKRRKPGQPFYFWYGGLEPHRSYEQGSGILAGKNPDQVTVPGFLPDNHEIRSDLLDYALEIEWFDKHLQKIIDKLKEIGEFENTIIIVTSDNGMPFPYAKANCNEYGIHVPLAICWPKQIKEGRKVDDLISFTDFVPTIIDITRISHSAMLPFSGKTIKNIFVSEKSGVVDSSKDAVFASRDAIPPHAGIILATLKGLSEPAGIYL